MGQGHFLHLLHQLQSVSKLQIFTAAKIYKIKHIGNQDYLVLGAKSASIISLNKADEIVIKTQEKHFNDWLWDFCRIGDYFYFLTAHNRVICTELNLEFISNISCQEKCILYSGTLVNSQLNEVTILAGSVFSQV